MSAPFCDTIVDYGVDASGALQLRWCNYVPTLRTIPNDTHATLEVCVNQEILPTLCCDGKVLVEYPRSFSLDGTLSIVSQTNCGVTVKRQFCPAAREKGSIQLVTLESSEAITLEIHTPQTQILGYKLGTKGVYVSKLRHTAPKTIALKPGISYNFTIYLSSAMADELDPVPQGEMELLARSIQIQQLCDAQLVLSTGIEELDAMA